MACTVGECGEPILTQGMCKTHYNHFYYMATSGQGRRKNNKIDLGGVFDGNA